MQLKQLFNDEQAEQTGGLVSNHFFALKVTQKGSHLFEVALRIVKSMVPLQALFYEPRVRQSKGKYEDGSMEDWVEKHSVLKSSVLLN